MILVGYAARIIQFVRLGRPNDAVRPWFQIDAAAWLEKDILCGNHSHLMMYDKANSRFDADLRESVDRLRGAVLQVAGDPSSRPGDSPSCEETRELLGLFARLQNEDVRRAVLDLMRTIVEVSA